MRALDAGVFVALIAGDLDPDRLGDEELAAPHLIDGELTNALRPLVLRPSPTDARAALALDGFTSLSLTWFPADWLRPGTWSLRRNPSAYQATYLASPS